MPKGKPCIDLTGQRFGRLVVLSQAERSKAGNIRWNCMCDCGNIAVVHGSSLREGHTLSCGCYQKEQAGNANRRHGESFSRIHNEWNAMRSRCNNPKNKRYKDYGGRGVGVCDEWQNNFEAFRDWAYANGYRDDLTLDRKDVDGNYSPSNCRWATQKEQQNNKRNNKLVTYNGETLTLKQWAEKLNINYITLTYRFRRGWDIERAFTYPVREIKNPPKRERKAKELGL